MFDDMLSCFDKILACDGRMDRQTSCNSTVCAMYSTVQQKDTPTTSLKHATE